MRFSAHTVGGCRQEPCLWQSMAARRTWETRHPQHRMDQQYLRHRGRSHGKAEKLDIHPPFVLYTWRGKEGDNTPVMLDIKIPEDFTNAPRSSLIVNQLTTMVQTKPDGYDGFVVIIRRCVRLSSIVYRRSRNHPHDRPASRQCRGMTR